MISSHISTYEKCATRLISSLVASGVKENNIYVTIGGSVKDEISNKIIYASHNSYDHNGILEIINNNLQSKYWFLTHDTCEAGLEFYHLLSKTPITKNYTAITEKAWLNMGLIDHQFINENKNYIKSLQNCSKKRAILSERVFSKISDYSSFGKQIDVEIIRDCKIYNDGKERITLYFPFLDYYKFQSLEAARVMGLIK